MQQQLNLSYATPISVYGKVVDEKGIAVAGATVQIGIADKPLPKVSTYTETTDTNGLFSLTGAHGIGFSLTASKDGYYTIEKSSGHRYVIDPADDGLPQPTKEQPIILVLRKQGLTEPLIAAESGQIAVPSSGQVVSIDLEIARLGGGGGSSLQVTSWVGDTNRRPYDWRYQLSIPGGGLIEREGRFSFEAPLEGYRTTVEVSMAATAAKWTFSAEREYFAKLPDGRYARFSIRFYPRQRNFVVIQSYVNPSGSRNLEYDPSKQVSAR